MTKKVTRVDKTVDLRKQTEEVLRASEERYRGLLTHLDAGVVVHAADTSVIMSNPRASVLLGLSDKQMRGKLAIDPKWKFLKENLTPFPIEEYPVNQIASKRQAIKDLVLGINRPATNDVAWVSVNGFPVFDDKGEISEIVISFIDITDRKQAEGMLQDKNEEYEALNEELRSSVEELQAATEELQAQNEELQQQEVVLRESEEKYRLLFNSGGDAIFIHDVEARILAVNQQACEQFGYTHAELLSMKVNQMDSPADGQHAPARIARVIEQGSLLFEIVHQRKDGSLIPHEVNTRRIIWDGQPAMMSICRDITARKQMEEALLNSEAQKNAILNGITTNIALVDKELKILWANKAAVSSVNKQVGEIVGHPCYSFWGDKVAPCANCPTLKAFQTGKAEHIIVETPDGRIWDERGEPILDADGNVTAVVEIAQDITDRKQAEEALRESEERFRILSEAAFEAIAIHEEGVLINANDQYFKMFGYEPGEAIGKQMMSKTIAPEARESVTNLIATNSLTPYESIGVRKDGTRFPIEIRGRKMDYKGRNVRFGAIVDITDRKQAEEELQEITERLHLATASAKAGVWDWNLQTNGMIWDDRMLELYGLTHENFPGGVEAWEQGLHPDDSSRAVEECQAALRGERDFDTEFRVRHPDGTVVHIKADGLVLRDEKGKPLRMIGLNTDITKSKQEQEEKANLEAQIQQSHKMESVGRLAGGVAHDFNNKLGVILGYTEMALDQVEPTLPLHADLEQIRTAANHAADLTRQLLAFARKQTVAPKVLDLNKTVTSMLKMLQRLIGENIHINWQPDANLWPIKVDPSQIDQILTNLCINARDAISDVGKMTIETGKCSFDEDYCAAYTGFLPGEYVLLAVSDNGCGMDKETLSHLFEPFYTTKVIGKGTGLGLATVYGIVRQNNGLINVYSEPDKGTTFRIYLPRHVGKTAQVQTRGPVEANSRGHETILLVEDDPSILEMTTRMLKKQGYTVLSANSPGEAIHLARERTGEIHLLMTDVVMPEMNGRDLAKNLLSLFPHLKRLFMSGYTANVIAHHGVLDEGVYFIQKPFSIKELAAKVREALDQE